MSNRDWDKELSKIDKQLESVSDAQLFPEKKAASAAQQAQVATAREAATSWPAILRLALSVALGVGILFWPYANRCGVGLAGYLIAVGVVAASGVWSAVWTWRHRTGRAHALSILLIAWGLILGATELLPRTGYARESLPWSCTPSPRPRSIGALPSGRPDLSTRGVQAAGRMVLWRRACTLSGDERRAVHLPRSRLASTNEKYPLASDST